MLWAAYVAVQEVRDSSGTALPALLAAVNADGSDYAYIESERLGRTSSKEQYAYVYDQSTVELTAPGATYPKPEGPTRSTAPAVHCSIWGA